MQDYFKTVRTVERADEIMAYGTACRAAKSQGCHYNNIDYAGYRDKFDMEQ